MLKLNTRGDTIVEVMISLAVLGLAFAISYSTAQSTLNDIQDSQEHSTALEHIESQVESLRYIANQPPTPGVSLSQYAFCITPSNPPGGGLTVTQFTVNSPGQNPHNYPAQCQIHQSGFIYYEAIIPTTTNNFNITIWWPGIGTLGNQSEELSYRIYTS